MAASPRARSGSRAPTRSPTSRRSSSSPMSICRPALGELFGITKLSGRGNLNVSLVASGASPFGLAPSLDGTATLTGHDGAIAGFNVEQLLKRLERRPLSGGGNFRSGSTPYDNLTVALKFNDGIATAEDVRVEGPTDAPDADRHGFGAGARIRPQGRRQPDAAAAGGARLRAAVRGAGPVGRSADLPRSGKPDPPLARRRAAARRGEGPQDARRRALGDRADSPVGGGRQPAGERTGRGGRARASDEACI